MMLSIHTLWNIVLSVWYTCYSTEDYGYTGSTEVSIFMTALSHAAARIILSMLPLSSHLSSLMVVEVPDLNLGRQASFTLIYIKKCNVATTPSTESFPQVLCNTYCIMSHAEKG
jgi:hypothetical protein